MWRSAPTTIVQTSPSLPDISLCLLVVSLCPRLPPQPIADLLSVFKINLSWTFYMNGIMAAHGLLSVCLASFT